MKNINSNSTLRCLSAAFLLGTSSAAFGQYTPVTAGEGVTFDQDDFTFDGDSPDVSSTGTAMVNPAALLAATSLSSGYLNIQDSSGWVVQNLPVNPALGSLSTDFNLGTPNGTDDTSSGLNLSVDISANPVTSFAPTASTPFSSTLVANDEEGEGATPANPAAPAANAVTFQLGGLFSTTFQSGHPNVQAADNQCGPAALANELSFLSTSEGLNIPDPNVPGRGDPATGKLTVPTGVVTDGEPGEAAGNSLVGRLDIAIGRTSSSRIDGEETTGQEQLVGLLTYLGSARVNDANSVVVTYQGNITGPTLTQSGITATSQGATVSPGYIYNQLALGDTVKLGITGHAEDVIGAGSVLGVPWLILNSDSAQTPVDLTDSSLGASPNTFVWDVNGTLYGGVGNPSTFNDISIQVAPEPSAVSLLAFAGFGLAMFGRAFKRAGQTGRDHSV